MKLIDVYFSNFKIFYLDEMGIGSKKLIKKQYVDIELNNYTKC